MDILVVFQVELLKFFACMYISVFFHVSYVYLFENARSLGLCELYLYLLRNWTSAELEQGKKILVGKFFSKSGSISSQILAGLAGRLEKILFKATALNPTGYPANSWPDCGVAAVRFAFHWNDSS